MDDFGTGYSSLSYLSRFPVDILKMDRSFLRDGASPQTSALATAVVALGETLQLEVVAEGIEYPEQWRGLRDLGCGSGQGFLFARPMDADATLEYLRAGAAGRPSPPPSMHHSYEGLDRAGGFSRVQLLAPLRQRDFRLLWSGMCVSLLGDGVFLVAMAWQVYALSNAPTALAIVGIAMTVPTIVFLLLGGVVSDRFDRRRVMLAADVGARPGGRRDRACCRSPARSSSGTSIALVAVYGAATAFFGPAFDAIVPDVAARRSCSPQANSLDQFVRPLALRLAGPAIGGVLIDGVGVGWAFALDARDVRRLGRRAARDARVARTARAARRARWRGDMRDGFAYVRRHVWLWGTFASAAVAYLLFMGPTEVLLPFVVKNSLGGSAADLGLVFAAGGVGSVGCAMRHGPARPPAARHHLHVRRLDARDAGGRRLRPRDRRLAADAREPRLQRARDGRHDRLGDRQAAPRAAGAARPRLEPRLADLDRAAAAVVRAHRPGQRSDRRAGDADRRRRARRPASRSPRCCCRACGRSRGDTTFPRPCGLPRRGAPRNGVALE